MTKFLNRQAKSIWASAIIVALGGIVSRLLGLLRERLIAGKFGASEQADIFYAAFAIPDFFYAILVMGAVTAAFIPVFTDYALKEKSGQIKILSRLEPKSEAFQIANSLLNLTVLFLGTVALAAFFLAPWIIDLIFPGFNPQAQALTVSLTRIMLVQPIILGISNLIGGILQSFRRFLSYCLAPVFYNLGIIGGILFFLPVWGLPGLAWGVILGSLFHLLIQLPAAWSSGFAWRPILSLTHPGLKKIITLMIPRAFGLAADRINILVILGIASTLSAGSLAIFNWANHVQYAPIGVIGIAFATAAFPALSQSFAQKNRQGFLNQFLSAFIQILFWIIPISVLLILLRAQIVRVIFGWGQFGWLDTRLTAAVLGLFALGIFAQSLIPLLARTFYALQDTKTPVLIALFSTIINIGAALFFVHLIQESSSWAHFLMIALKLQGIKDIAVLGLPMAFLVAGVIQFSLLLAFLYQKLGGLALEKLSEPWLKVLLASALMAITTWGMLRPLSALVNMQSGLGVFAQGLGAGLAGILVYLIAGYFLKIPETKKILAWLKTRP